MSIGSFAPGKEITNPRGMWSAVAQKRKDNPERASFMQNARVKPGVVGSRPGTSAVVATQGKVSGPIFNWITPSGQNLALYMDNGAIKLYAQSGSPTALTTTPSNTRFPSFADIDIWTYFTGAATSGSGTMQCRITDGTNVDKAFRGPVTINAASAVDGGPGQCTAGTHYIGFVYQNRTGFTGAPSTSIGGSSTSPPTSTYPNLPVPSFTPTQSTGSGWITGGQDVPVNIAVSGVTTFAGWASSSSNHVVACLMYIDGHYCGQASYGAYRPDVQAANVGGLAGAYAGFTFVFDLSQLAAGAHTWYTQIILDDGRTQSMPQMSFQIIGSGAPISVRLASGLRLINVSVTIPAVSDGGGIAELYLIMTRADNPQTWYFMPTDPDTGAIGTQPVPLNTATTLTFVANLSDEDMANSLAGDTASENFLLLTQDSNGNGPFNPSFVAPYGNRMCYGVGSNLYVSNINDPQHITGDQHVVTPPSKRNIAYAFPLPGGTDLFITGDKWTSKVTDNSDVPATWPVPLEVSPALGAPFPGCVCYLTKGSYAWIALEGGLYNFNGQYPEKPVTYLVSDQWKRINWNAAYAIQVADDIVNLKVYVAAPLDQATEPSGLFVIDYQNGLEFDQVDISLDILNPSSFSSIGIVKEAATGTTNLWIGPAAAGNIIHFDPTTPNDLGQPINSYWESGLMRGKADFISSMIRVGALDLWVRGAGSLNITVYGPDHVQSVPRELLSLSGVPMTLSQAPGIMGAAKIDLARIENYTVSIGTNAVNASWEMSSITGYAKADLFNR